MTIVYCIPSLAEPGGMQRVLTVKANYLASVKGYIVYVVVRSSAGGPPYFALSPLVRVHVIDKRWSYRRQLEDLLYSVQPDITVSLYGAESRWLWMMRDGSRKVLEFHFTRNHLVHHV